MKKMIVVLLVAVVLIGGANIVQAEELVITKDGMAKYVKMVDVLTNIGPNTSPAIYLEFMGFSREEISMMAGYFLTEIQRSLPEEERSKISLLKGFSDEYIDDMDQIIFQVYMIKFQEILVAVLGAIDLDETQKGQVDALAELKRGYLRDFFPFDYRSYETLCLGEVFGGIPEIPAGVFPEWPASNP